MTTDINPNLLGWRHKEAEDDWPYQRDQFVAFATMAEPEDPDYHFAWVYAQ